MSYFVPALLETATNIYQGTAYHLGIQGSLANSQNLYADQHRKLLDSACRIQTLTVATGYTVVHHLPIAISPLTVSHPVISRPSSRHALTSLGTTTLPFLNDTPTPASVHPVSLPSILTDSRPRMSLSMYRGMRFAISLRLS